MKADTMDALKNTLWDILLPTLADKLTPEEYELAVFLHILSADELDAGQVVSLIEFICHSIHLFPAAPVFPPPVLSEREHQSRAEKNPSRL